MINEASYWSGAEEICGPDYGPCCVYAQIFDWDR